MWLEPHEREANGALRRPLSTHQKLVLQAAAAVDYLPLRYSLGGSNIPNGVWQSLVDRQLLRPHPLGWEITPEGRARV